MINSPDSTINDVDPVAISTYLSLIYPPEYGWQGQISVAHSLPDGTGMPSVRTSRSLAMPSTKAFAEGARRQNAPGTYLRCTTVRADLAPGRRGGVADSVELPGLWADLDIDGPGHRHDPAKHGGRHLPKTVDAALGIITASKLPWPTAVVHSGGGLYAWWLFDRRVELNGVGRGYWGARSEAWQARLASAAEGMGLHYGVGVGNLDRVLGLVGTLNAKVSGNPRMRVLTDLGSGQRFAPEDLAAQVNETIEALAAGTRASIANRGVSAQSALRAQAEAGTDMPLAASTLQPVRPADHLSPLDDFERRHSWAEILIPKGWTLISGDATGGPCEWRRPGASHPLSASTGRDQDRDRMWCFSDAAGLPAQEPLTKGYVFAALWHGGDMSAAAAAVQQLGYGTVAQQRAQDSDTGHSGVEAQQEGRRLELVAASSMGGPRASRWLWEEAGAHWLPLGGLCLLGGREGVGKTTWTYRLIAQLTQGTLPGDLDGQPRSAVIAATEDSWEHTIIPRLMAAGADLNLVYRIDAVEPDRRTGVCLPEDLGALGELLAQHPEIGMLVLDPIITVLSAKLDSHKDHEVRKALEPISALAHGTGITVLGLIHDNKSSGNDLSTRLMGSRAFVAVARAALVCTEERDEPDDGVVDNLGADPVQVDQAMEPVPASSTAAPRTFLLGQVKNNLEARANWSIRYQIGAITVAHDDEAGKDVRGSHIVRIGRQTRSLEDIVQTQERSARWGGQEPRAQIGAAILEALNDGEEHASAEIKAWLTEDGHSLRTIMRAAGELVAGSKIIATKRGRETYWQVAKGNLSSSPTPPYQSDDISGMDVISGTDGTRGTGVEASVRGNHFTEADTCHVPRATSPRAREELARIGDTCHPCGCSAALPAGQHAPWCTAGQVSA